MNKKHLRRVKFFVSTKADLLTEKVNKWLNEMEEQHGDNFVASEVQPSMSYTTIKDKGAYMISCCITYILFIDEEEETK